MKKRCTGCNLDLNIDCFYRHAGTKDGRNTRCKQCHRLTASQKRDREKTRKATNAWKQRHPERVMLHGAKVAAKRNGYPFNITLGDVYIPNTCPVLGIPLYFTPGRRTENTPSLDRLNNQRGYVKGNVAVVSWRANQLKRDASLEELRALVDFLELRGV